MPMAMKIATLAIVGVLILGSSSPGGRLHAQQPGAESEAPAVTPAEIQRMFDAYALVQAQDQLKLGDDQYPQFLARFKALQEIHRRFQSERGRAIQELRRLAADAKSDESVLKERIKALQELEARTAVDVRKSYDAIDQVLSVRQQAQFRGFEELIERRKIELVTRARQNNRPNGRALRGRP
jgi:Spy/CpxP family protein refolding chaperone